MQKRLLWGMLLLAMGVGPIFAAESRPALPPNVVHHVAVKAPGELVERLDATIVAITEDTNSAMPPGIVAMIAQMQLPMSELFLEHHTDVPWHFLMPNPEELVIIVATSLDRMKESLKVELEPDESSRAFSARLPQMGPTCFVEGDGYVAMARDQYRDGLLALVESMGDWSPAYTYGGDVFFQSDLPPDWFNLLPQARETTNFLDGIRKLRGERKQELHERLPELGIKPEVVEGLLMLLDNYTSGFFLELSKADQGVLILDLSAGRLGLKAQVGFSQPSFGAKMIANSAARGPVDARTISVADDALAIGVLVAPDLLVPDYQNLARRFNREIAEAMFPAMREQWEKLTDQVLRLRLGNYLTATDIRPEGQVSTVWMKTADGGKLLELQKETMNLLNAVLDETITRPEYRFVITTTDGTTEDGVAYVKTTFNVKDVAAFIMALAGENNVVIDEIQAMHALFQLSNFAQYSGVKNNVFVSVSGVVDEDDFVDALRRADSIDAPPALSAPVQAAVDSVKSSRDMLFIIDMDKASVQFGRQIAEVVDQSEGGTFYSEILESMIDDMDTTGSFGAFGIGAADNMMSINISMPNEGINAIWRNAEVYEGTVAELLEMEDEDEDEDEDEWEGDVDDDSVDEEDVELDEPAGAA